MQPPQHSEPECAGVPLDLESAAAPPRRKTRRRSRRGRPAEDAPSPPAGASWWQVQTVRLSAMAAIWLGY